MDWVMKVPMESESEIQLVYQMINEAKSAKEETIHVLKEYTLRLLTYRSFYRNFTALCFLL